MITKLIILDCHYFDIKTPIISSSKKILSSATSKEDRGSCRLDSEGVLLEYFVDCSVRVS